MTLQTNTNIILSLRKMVKTQLTALGYAHVYGEQEMRAGTTATDRRYIYLIDQFVVPTKAYLPFVVLEVQDIVGAQFELGNRNGRTFEVYLHIWGRSRIERHDIASYLQDNIPTGIDYLDFSADADGDGVDYGRGKIERGDNVNVDNVAIPMQQITELSLLNASLVSFSARVKQ